MVTNFLGDSLSLWKATDLTPLGSISVGFPTGGPFNVCGDGQDFWVTLRSDGAGGGSTIKKYLKPTPSSRPPRHLEPLPLGNA
jgi:hypothetical protein